MAKPQSQLRVIMVAPANDVSTIHEVDEDSASLCRSPTRRGVNSSLSSDPEDQLQDSQNSLQSSESSLAIVPAAAPITTAAEDNSKTTTATSPADRKEQVLLHNQTAASERLTVGLYPLSEPSTFSASPTVPGRCTLPNVVIKHNEMEHDLLLDSENKNKQQLNGGATLLVTNERETRPHTADPPAVSTDALGADYVSERRATVTSAHGHLDLLSLSGRKYRLHHKPVPGLTYNRSLSLSTESHRLGLGGSKQLAVGSVEGLPRASIGHYEHPRLSIFQHKLDAEHKYQPKYGSTLSNIGVEYMKAAGAMGVRFKQLQKPHHQSDESINGTGHHDSEDHSEARRGTVNHLVSDLPLIIPMHGAVPMKSPDTDTRTASARTATSHQSHHGHVGYKLGQRKTLAEQRRKLADYSGLFALIGMLLMVIEMESTIGQVYTKDQAPSYVIKSLITLTTIVTLCLIGAYHAVEVKLFVIDNCIEDWRIAMSWSRMGQIMLELIACAIHPVPGSFYFSWAVLDVKTLQWVSVDVTVDVLLSLPMIARIYLIVRVLLLHSKLFTDASSRSIGALNKITFNTRFVLKTLMNIFPGTVLVVFMMSLLVVCAWTLRACECWHDPLLANLLNSIYLVAITFLSVGYGDFVPKTYCGRSVSVLSGLMGAFCTALVVAVIAKRLELTRAEKHVHNFMIENQLSKKLKHAAANVLRETWLIYKYTKLVKRVHATRIRAHQRKFLSAINDLRKVKLKQRKLADQANSLTDFAQTTALVLEIVSDMRHTQTSNDERLDSIEHSIANLQHQLEALPATIAQILAEKQATMSCTSAPEPSPANPPGCGTLNRRTSRLRHYDRNQNSFDSGP